MSEIDATALNKRSAELQPERGKVERDDGEVNLLDMLIVLVKHKRLVVGFPVAVAIIAAVVSVLLPSTYTATTKILPPQQNQANAASMLAQLGGLAGVVGGAVGLKSPNELYIGMLKSRTVAHNVIARFSLNVVFKADLLSDTVEKLDRMTRITSGKDGIIAIEVEDLDPKRAAAIANTYVDELYKLTNVLAVTEASQRRLFFERQLENAKEQLAKAESAAKRFMDKGGVLQVEGQGRAIIEAAARLRGQIAAKEVQLGAMRIFATERNADFAAAQQELQAMRNQLAIMEGSGNGKVASRSASDASEGIDSLNSLRNVKYYETIFEALAKQYELAKLDESKDSAVIQVLDKAIEPDRRSTPKRKQIVVFATLAAAIVAVLLAFIKETLDRVRQNPEESTKLSTLRRYLTSR